MGRTGMGMRKIGAVLAITGAAIFGTAGVAAAADYPPTTVAPVTAASQAPATTAAPVQSAGNDGLPFTGSDTTELFVIGAAIAGAGTLVLVRTHRGARTGRQS